MELLKDAPAEFGPAAKAFAMARLMPATHRLDLKIGLASGGVLFAVGRLDGYRQAHYFRDHLRELGWREHLLGGDDDMHGCDMLFSLPPRAQTRGEDDPSFIRRPSVELWPMQGNHAEA